MKHFSLMILFALIVATVFGLLGRETRESQFKYGVKVFLEFVGIGIILAWLMYLIP